MNRCLLLFFLLVQIVYGASQAPAASADPAALMDRLQYLQAEIARHDDLYHVQGRPEISDDAYDELVWEMRRLRSQLHAASGSDLSWRSSQESRKADPHSREHREPMRSLAKVHSADELVAWARGRADELAVDDLAFVVEPKYDGVAVSLVYENGVLRYALTRGDGKTGQVVSASLVARAGIPVNLLTTDFPPRFVEIRGEACVSLREFDAGNARQTEAGLDAYAHPRSMASALVNSDLGGLHGPGSLTFVAFGLGAVSGQMPSDQLELYAMLSEWGFIAPDAFAVDRIEGLCSAAETAMSHRAERPIETDGIVVKLRSRVHAASLGDDADGSRGAVAFKYPAEATRSRLLGIELQIGRTGRITPVACFEPVIIDGRSISRANLHHGQFLEELDLAPGDWLQIELRGGLIPQVVGRTIDAEGAGRTAIDMEQLLRARSLSGQVRCDNGIWTVNDITHPALATSRLAWFASSQGMDIRGFGEESAAKLVAAGLCLTPADLLSLSASDLARCLECDMESAHLLFRQIQETRLGEFWQLLRALSIPGIGERGAHTIAEAFHSPIELVNATPATVLSMPGLSSAAAESLLHWLDVQDGREELRRFASAGTVGQLRD